MLPSDSSDDDLESRADTFLSDQSSVQQQQQQLQQQALRRNQPPTASTRRMSRQLFAQKYGLNAPSSGSSHPPAQVGRRLSDPCDHDDDDDDDDENDDSEDERPLHMLSQQQQQVYPRVGGRGLARPISVCNIAEATSPARPSRFVKPATQTPRHTQVPSDMQQVQLLGEHFNRKVYMEGYLAKMNDLTTDGRPCTDRRWAQHYVELCGPVLTLWNAEFTDDQEQIQQRSSSPEYININDSYVELLGDNNNNAAAGPQQFVLNSAGANRYVFQAISQDTDAQTWVLAIRLACFEGARIHEIYTRRFVSRYSDVLMKRPPKVEGFLQARFPGQTEWKKYWTVVTDRRTEKRFFGKKSVPTRGQLMFYESKKAKFPVKMIVNVVQAYTIYPAESPQLTDLATLMKVEGNIYDCLPSNGEQKLSRLAASVLVMASNAKELTQWLVGTFDAFKLYGRPTKLLDEPADGHALNFGEPRMNRDLPRLFLEVPEAQQVNVAGETLLDNKLAFASILEQKMRRHPSVVVPPPNNNTAGLTMMMGSRTNSMPLISGIPTSPSSHALVDDHASAGAQQRRPTLANTLPAGSQAQQRHSAPLLQQMNSPPQQPNTNRYSSQLSIMAAGRPRQTQHQTYASDESDDDDNDDDDDDGDETSSTSSTFEKTIPISQPTTAAKPSQSSPQQTETAPTTPSITAASTSAVAAAPTPTSSSANATRRQSTMTLPEISESNDFMTSILGDMKLDNQNKATPGPPPPTPAHITPVASTSTPNIGQATKQHQQRAITKCSNSSSDSSSIVSSSKKVAATCSPASPSTAQPHQQSYAAKSRPTSAMAWRRSSSNLLMRPQSSSSGSSSSASMTPSGSETSSMGHGPPQQQQRQYYRGSMQMPPTQPSRGGPPAERRSMYMNDNGGRRSSSAILLQQRWETPEEEDEEEHPPMGMVPQQQQQQQQPPPPPPFHQQQQQYDPYGYQQYQHYVDDDDDDDDAPIVPQIGTNFVTQNSLLDMYQSEQLPAHVQEENARISGQPLVNLPNKPPQPRAGLVGMISQLEHEKKERDSVKGRLLEMEKERALEQERGRFYFDQQQQQQRYSAMMQQPSSPNNDSVHAPPPPPMMTPQSMMAAPSPPQTPYGGGGGGMMMDPRMSMPMMNPQMMMMPMMAGAPQPMMDPRMSMMPNMAMMYMMQGSYGQMPPPTMPMFYNPMMMMQPQEKVEDDDDDVPLGPPIHNNNNNHHHHHHRQQQQQQQRQRSNSHHF